MLVSESLLRKHIAVTEPHTARIIVLTDSRMLGSRYNRFKRPGRSHHDEERLAILEGFASDEPAGSSRPKSSYEMNEFSSSTHHQALEQQLNQPDHPSTAAKFAGLRSSLLSGGKPSLSRKHATMRSRLASRTTFLIKVVLMLM